MKPHIIVALAFLLSLSCEAQQKLEKSNDLPDKKSEIKAPKGNWQVDKEFDENGNLIRYDSIYSWSSYDNLDKLSSSSKDSLLMTMQTRFFQNFSNFNSHGFPDVFSQDSLLNQRFFNDDFFGSDFGKDIMDIDKMRQNMMKRQRMFLEKYQRAFIKPEEDH